MVYMAIESQYLFETHINIKLSCFQDIALIYRQFKYPISLFMNTESVNCLLTADANGKCTFFQVYRIAKNLLLRLRHVT